MAKRLTKRVGGGKNPQTPRRKTGSAARDANIKKAQEFAAEVARKTGKTVTLRTTSGGSDVETISKVSRTGKVSRSRTRKLSAPSGSIAEKRAMVETAAVSVQPQGAKRRITYKDTQTGQTFKRQPGQSLERALIQSRLQYQREQSARKLAEERVKLEKRAFSRAGALEFAKKREVKKIKTVEKRQRIPTITSSLAREPFQKVLETKDPKKVDAWLGQLKLTVSKRGIKDTLEYLAKEATDLATGYKRLLYDDPKRIRSMVKTKVLIKKDLAEFKVRTKLKKLNKEKAEELVDKINKYNKKLRKDKAYFDRQQKDPKRKKSIAFQALIATGGTVKGAAVLKAASKPISLYIGGRFIANPTPENLGDLALVVGGTAVAKARGKIKIVKKGVKQPKGAVIINEKTGKVTIIDRRGKQFTYKKKLSKSQIEKLQRKFKETKEIIKIKEEDKIISRELKAIRKLEQSRVKELESQARKLGFKDVKEQLKWQKLSAKPNSIRFKLLNRKIQKRIGKVALDKAAKAIKTKRLAVKKAIKTKKKRGVLTKAGRKPKTVKQVTDEIRELKAEFRITKDPKLKAKIKRKIALKEKSKGRFAKEEAERIIRQTDKDLLEAQIAKRKNYYARFRRSLSGVVDKIKSKRVKLSDRDRYRLLIEEYHLGGDPKRLNIINKKIEALENKFIQDELIPRFDALSKAETTKALNKAKAWKDAFRGLKTGKYNLRVAKPKKLTVKNVKREVQKFTKSEKQRVVKALKKQKRDILVKEVKRAEIKKDKLVLEKKVKVTVKAKKASVSGKRIKLAPNRITKLVQTVKPYLLVEFRSASTGKPIDLRKVKTIPDTKVELIIRPRRDISNPTKRINDFVRKLKPIVEPKIVPDVKQRRVQEPKTDVKPITKLKTKPFIRSKPKGVKEVEEIKKPRIKIPRIDWQTKTPKGYVKVVEIYVKIGNRIKRLKLKTTPNRALRYVKGIIDNTTARSFQLKVIGLAKGKDIGKQGIPKFRKRKGKDPKVLFFVEKSKHAIDTPGEKIGLSVAKYLKKRLSKRK